MGQAKAEMLREMQRGYRLIRGNICSTCILEPAIKELHDEIAEPGDCDFCKATGVNVAEASEIQTHIMNCLLESYIDVDDANAPYDSREGGYQVNYSEASEIISESLVDVVSEDFSEAICDAVGYTNWCDRDWQILSPHERLNHGWIQFCSVCKSRLRFLFAYSEGSEDCSHPDYNHPTQTLEGIGEIVESIGLVQTIKRGTRFYRIRVAADRYYTEVDDLGCPPQNKATANRMSPAGMPMLYLAEDENTAICETWDGVGFAHASIAQFELLEDINVVDFSMIPVAPSFWSHPDRQEFANFTFLNQLAIDLSLPVPRGVLGDIHYAPTQIVCEYLTKVRFGFPKYGKIPDGYVHGIAFSSSRTGARNFALNLFHDQDKILGLPQKDFLKLVQVEHRELSPTNSSPL